MAGQVFGKPPVRPNSVPKPPAASSSRPSQTLSQRPPMTVSGAGKKPTGSGMNGTPSRMPTPTRPVTPAKPPMVTKGRKK